MLAKAVAVAAVAAAAAAAAGVAADNPSVVHAEDRVRRTTTEGRREARQLLPHHLGG